MAKIEEASPICRGKNLSWETILLFYNNMPREAMPKAQFHAVIEAKIAGWTQTHSQIARQLAFYYEKDGKCYPRFTSDISYTELFKYMQNWAAKYFIPNPFAPSLKGYTPTCIYETVYNAVISGESDFDIILDSMFGVELSSHDKIKVYLSNFTNLLFNVNHVSLNNRSPHLDCKLNPNPEYATDAEQYFSYFNVENSMKEVGLSDHEPLLLQSDDPTTFVWETLKFLNKRDELKTLFTSKYRGTGGSIGNYVTINGCYVAQTGKLEGQYLESIQIYDNSFINNGFDARDIERFAEAINDIYSNQYRVEIQGEDDEETYRLIQLNTQIDVNSEYTPYLTALRTKPFMLLAGISGTGKSRIAREIAKACWPVGHEQRTKQVPENFCMVQVKPNWHDSTELLGYISRINGEKYVVGDFTKFVAKATQHPERPYILCLDEMNLAPVEQYFAEYLSVVESRKAHEDGTITTDPLIDYENTEAYKSLIDQLIRDEQARKEYLTEQDGKRLTIPQNLFVIGTVNMDETTFSFSRKVLDRAMTIEMNEVNLFGGLEKSTDSDLGYIGNIIIGHAAEGKDVYADNKQLCDAVINYLGEVNNVLEGTPFKIAYRTRNEFLLYAVNRLVIAPESELWQTLDEMTSMKILSRVEGDSERCKKPLEEIQRVLNETLSAEQQAKSISLAKIKEMLDKLQKTGYTSYWT